MYYLYILKSLKDQKGYIGVTSNIEKRIREHNSGKEKSTKHRTPFGLAHSEVFLTLSEARKREWFFKCAPQGGKLKKKILDMAGVAADQRSA